ncbi:MAG: hypothetical protein H6736_09125 [Alphaproteobacteria bacterium]|nr:hypothetical protein [Alphaproteobacteria bacterium]MCB9691965.1 hypothetical protein [Alphaproteobacteria bacterium]
MLLALWATLANAQSVLVQPSQSQGREGDERGLGFALSALLEEDLALVPGLEVGEDDPEWTVRGTWRVADRRLEVVWQVLDDGGEVVGRTEVDGALGDYLTVSRRASTLLIQNLGLDPSPGVVRRIMAGRATESLAAVVAWGLGLERLAEDDLEGALESFERAADEDPGFDRALVALATTRAEMERRWKDASETYEDVFTLRMQKALERIPSELGRRGATVDAAEWRELAARWAISAELGRSCDVAAEMRHYLLRTQAAFPDRARKGLSEVFERFGLGDDLTGGRLGREALEATAPAPHVLAFVGSPYRGSLVSLLGSTLECHTDLEDRLSALEALVDAVDTLPLERRSAAARVHLALAATRGLIHGLDSETQRALQEAGSYRLSPIEQVKQQKDIERVRAGAARVSTVIEIIRPYTIVDLDDALARWYDAPGEGPLCPSPPKNPRRDPRLRLEVLLADGELTPVETETLLKGVVAPVLTARILGCMDAPALVTDVTSGRAFVEAVVSRRPPSGSEAAGRLAMDPSFLAGWDPPGAAVRDGVCTEPPTLTGRWVELGPDSCEDTLARVEAALAVGPSGRRSDAAVRGWVREAVSAVVSGCGQLPEP